MHAATTKISLLLYSKDLLKAPNQMYDSICNRWFIYKKMLDDGDGRKTPKYKNECEN